MHGIIFSELKKYADETLGPGVWPRLLTEAGMQGRIFMPIQAYPDADAATLVATASRMTGQPADAILQAFGEFIAPDLLKMYASLVPRDWRTLDVIENTEETIHRVVRSRQPGASPPELRVYRGGPDAVTVHYASERRMCGVAKGIIRGVARHYGETVSISEPECMLKGQAACRLEVRRTAAAGAA